jgi:hypothetical protein
VIGRRRRNDTRQSGCSTQCWGRHDRALEQALTKQRAGSRSASSGGSGAEAALVLTGQYGESIRRRRLVVWSARTQIRQQISP